MQASVRPHLCFYQLRDFAPASLRYVPRSYDAARLQIPQKFATPLRTVLEYFEEVGFERVGTLRGEYVAANVGLLVRRDGMLIKMNIAAEEPWASRKIDELCTSAELAAQVKLLQKNWDRLPVIEDAPLLSHPYHDNYFHWSLEVIPNLRFFAEAKAVAVCEPCLHRTFQRNLLGHTAGQNRMILPLRGAAVIRNPGLFATTMTEEAVWWLRQTTGFNAKPGRRRLYLRRSGASKRWPPGGGLCEDAAFLDFLARNRFETVETGGAECKIADQVELLAEAAVILAPHGAGLTNLAYLSPPLSVIEVMGSQTARAMFIHLSAILGFSHHVVFSDRYDEAGNIRTDCADLQAALEACDPPRPS